MSFQLVIKKISSSYTQSSAFEFKTLFFPTVHIHDNEVHSKADFHHTLYYQCEFFENLSKTIVNEGRGGRDEFAIMDLPYDGMTTQASDFMDIDKTKGIIDAEKNCYGLWLEGELDNRDIWISKATDKIKRAVKKEPEYYRGSDRVSR